MVNFERSGSSSSSRERLQVLESVLVALYDAVYLGTLTLIKFNFAIATEQVKELLLAQRRS